MIRVVLRKRCTRERTPTDRSRCRFYNAKTIADRRRGAADRPSRKAGQFSFRETLRRETFQKDAFRSHIRPGPVHCSLAYKRSSPSGELDKAGENNAFSRCRGLGCGPDSDACGMRRNARHARRHRRPTWRWHWCSSGWNCWRSRRDRRLDRRWARCGRRRCHGSKPLLSLGLSVSVIAVGFATCSLRCRGPDPAHCRSRPYVSWRGRCAGAWVSPAARQMPQAPRCVRLTRPTGALPAPERNQVDRQAPS